VLRSVSDCGADEALSRRPAPVISSCRIRRMKLGRKASECQNETQNRCMLIVISGRVSTRWNKSIAANASEKFSSPNSKTDLQPRRLFSPTHDIVGLPFLQRGIRFGFGAYCAKSAAVFSRCFRASLNHRIQYCEDARPRRVPRVWHFLRRPK